ncbi:MAG: hypothetical protein ABR591_01540 [Candidatus Velthaea sp.]
MLKRSWPVLALALLVAGCGGGGGGGSSSPAAPAPVVTTAPPVVPPNTSFTVATGGVTTLAANPANTFGSTLLPASTDGTFIVQSPETPAESGDANFTLLEYTVSGSESAGQSTSAVQRAPQAAVRTSDGGAPVRVRLDPRSTTNYTRSVLRAHPLRLGANGGRAPLGVRRAQALTAGATQTFHIDQFKITGAGSTCANPVAGFQCFVDKPSTLVSVSNFAYVWVDNAVLNNAAYNLTQTQFDAVGTDFDSVYAKETALFGQAFVSASPTPSFQQCDSSGRVIAPTPVPDLSNTDPHISIVITNALESNGEGGYFSLANLFNEAELECASPGNIEVTNHTKMLVIGADSYRSGPSGAAAPDPSFWQNFDMPRSIAHEFQHYLHAINRYVNPIFSLGQNGEVDDAFIDEGCAMLAEDLAQPGNAQSEDSAFLAFLYLFQAGNYSLTSFSGFDANPLDTSATPTYGFFHNTAGDYGQAYLFMRYIFDRFGSAGIARMFADRTPSLPSSSPSANIAPILAASGESFAQLYGEFAAALSASGTASTDPRFNFSPQVRLRGEMFFHEPGGKQVYATFNGPRSPEDLTAASPGTVGRIKFSVGAAPTAKLLQGATLFFNAAANPSSGATVRAQVTGAPAGSSQAILVQGAYTDRGSCAAPQPDSNCNPTVTP